jgi:hypothetical protein
MAPTTEQFLILETRSGVRNSINNTDELELWAQQIVIELPDSSAGQLQ